MQCLQFQYYKYLERNRNREIEREREQNNTIKIEELRYGAKCNSDFMNKQEEGGLQLNSRNHNSFNRVWSLNQLIQRLF